MTLVLAALFTVRALTLPAHATIDPFASRPQMSVAPSGAIAATVVIGGFTTRTVAWNAAGGWHLVPAPPFSAAPESIDLTVATYERDATLLLNATARYAGPAPAMRFRASRVAGTKVTPLDFSSCAYPRNSSGTVVAGAYADGDLVATMESPPLVDIDDLSGQTAPVVVRLRGTECAYLGNGYAIGVDGDYAAGYASYVGNVPESDVSVKERFVAMRWHGDERRALGAGVALAVDASGIVAGADAPAGTLAEYGADPHAVRWDPSGARLDLAPQSPRSVAYAVDEQGNVVGTLQDDDGRHYAFLWENGHLSRLDDLVHAAGWRFECAYAFGPNGEIVGIGTHDGVAMAFELSPRAR
ncbi:MAG TPA: hypothetical protein VMH02_12735 [Verrucomicrobiae bacterium]|nr:hypothetical protein [Verrucomicrobiae bacterium]